MDIDGLTTCVGPEYARLLGKALPVWNDTLDSIIVVTTPDDELVRETCAPYARVRVVSTPLFREHGASFNKGAALSVGYAAMDPLEGALTFDADILPPASWRKRAEAAFRAGCVHGARRTDERGVPITDLGDWPYGYFQLWHAGDPLTWSWPLFDPWHGHAGNYDLEFLERWRPPRRRDLGIRVIHHGEVRRNWFGVGLSCPQEQEASFAKMDGLVTIGLRATRLASRHPQNRLRVPPFAMRLAIPPHSKHSRALVRACMTDDPFLVQARVGQPRPGDETLLPLTRPEELRRRVEVAYQERHGQRP